MVKAKKKCVFCGNPPNNKNKEHILSQWLLKMTGDPNRVVRLGYDYIKKREIKFNWKSLTVPSCSKCNEEYSELENITKPIIEKLLNRAELNGFELLTLLDWLDKVRIGLWLNYFWLEKNKGQISPRMYIKNRLGSKDRFLQLHFLTSKENPKGLNTFGPETFVFQFNPSCFALRINDILIMNGSNDFLISKNCGFPYPTKIITDENGKIGFKDFVKKEDTIKEIEDLPLPKGVLLIMQPIHVGIEYDAKYFDNDIRKNCINPWYKVGTLFRVSNDSLIPINNFTKQQHYEVITDKDSTSIVNIASKVYEGQNAFLSRVVDCSNPSFKKAMEFNNFVKENLLRYRFFQD